MRLPLKILSLFWTTAIAGELSANVRTKRQESLPTGKHVVCYYANWAVYRQGTAKFTPQNINPYLCTHLIYAFGGLGKDDRIKPFDEYQDIEKGGYARFAALKTYNKELKTLLAIGGWNEGSKRFSPLVGDRERRRTFIRSAITFLRQYNFDGLDLDWEYPTFRAGGQPEDRINYAKLVIELREAFESEAEATGKARLIVTMAVPASLEYAGKGYDIATLDKHLDFFNLLTYDYHSSNEPATNHHSPLFRPNDVSEFDFRADLNIDATVKFYLKSGASREKLVLGIPTYGRSYTLINPEAHQISSPTDGPGKKGKGTKEDGYLAYYEICEAVQGEDWQVEYPHPGKMGPYTHKGDQWVGYDDEEAVMEKAFYVAEEDLGGIMFWTIDNDDFRGACSDRPFPLIESAKEAMYSNQIFFETKTSVSVSTSEDVRTQRVRLTQQELARLTASSTEDRKLQIKRKPASHIKRPPPPKRLSSNSSRFSPSTTPEPPTTPSSGPAFSCKSEGFFPHPSSCKKYYWCLETPANGPVAHTFTCPQGLFFNKVTDGCDFRRNVNCGGKDDTDIAPSTTTTTTTEAPVGGVVEEPKTLKELLELVKAAGGVEGLEKQIEEEEVAEKNEEERRQRISNKTRNRLSQLLNLTKTKKKSQTRPDTTTVPRRSPRPPPTTTSEKPTTRRNLIARLANKRRPNLSRLLNSSRSRRPVQPPQEQAEEQPPKAPKSTIPTSNPTRSSSSFRKRPRPSFRTRLSTSRTRQSVLTTQPPSVPTATRRSLLRSRFRNPLAQRVSSSTTTTTTTTPAPTTTTTTTLAPLVTSVGITDPSDDSKIQIIGSHLKEEPTSPVPLRLGIFKPEDGTREKLRETLHEVLKIEMEERRKEKEAKEDEIAGHSTNAPVNTVTISRNTRINGQNPRTSLIGRPKIASAETASSSINSERNRDLEYVTIERSRSSTANPTFDGDRDSLPSSRSFSSTADDDSDLKYVTIQRGQPTTPSPADPGLNQVDVVGDRDSASDTFRPTLSIVADNRTPFFPTTHPDTDDDSDNTFQTTSSLPTTLREVPRNDNIRKLEIINIDNSFRDNILDNNNDNTEIIHIDTQQETDQPVFNEIVEEEDVSPFQTTFVQRPLRPVPQLDVTRSRSRSRSRPPTTATLPPRLEPRQPVQPAALLEQAAVVTRPRLPVRTTPAPVFEYEYYYDYIDETGGGHATDYDLVPLANKVRILSDGAPHCLDVGVFPHPFSCKKFISCFRNPGTGIVGSIYECPAYLAFDPVGGHCNWVSEIVCSSTE